MKTVIANLSLLTIILSFSTARNAFSNSPSEVSKIEEATDVRQNPLEAIQKLIELGKNASNISEDLANRDPVEPISFKELIEYLPEPPPGWAAGEPKGATSSFGSYSISQVNQAYTQGDRKIKVSIFDWAFNSALYVPFLLSTEFSHESTEGYSKGIKIGDIPGREEYSYSSRRGSLNALVDSRFLIQIEGRNIKDVELRKWWELMNRSLWEKVSHK